MAVKSYWREVAAPIIRQCLQDTVGQTEKEIRAALIEAYPFGERRMHPYKIWCDEVRRQRGLKRKKGGKKQTSLNPVNVIQTQLF